MKKQQRKVKKIYFLCDTCPCCYVAFRHGEIIPKKRLCHFCKWHSFYAALIVIAIVSTIVWSIG